MFAFFKSKSKMRSEKSTAGSSGRSSGRSPTGGVHQIAVTKQAVSGMPGSGDSELQLPHELSRGITLEDFDLLKVLGKGGFGKVMLVRKKHTTDIYAMKVLKKEAVIQRNQVAHTKTETHILKQIRHPFLTRMHYGTRVCSAMPAHDAHTDVDWTAS